jgi:hypothetical protein
MLARDGAHLGIFSQTTHAKVLNTAIASCANYTPHQFGADALLLPRLLNRKGCFSLLAPRETKFFQLCGSSKFAIYKKSIDKRPHLAHARSIIFDEGV